MEEYSDNKFTKNQIIALIIMGLILISVFILRPDPYREMDQYDQQQDQIRIQISNERRMQKDAEEAARNGAESTTAPTTDTTTTAEDRSMELEKFIAY